MNTHSKLVIIPFHLLAIVGMFYVADYWAWAVLFWFLFGIVGNGVVGHRYFAHRSFRVANWLHTVLAYVNVMAAFAPPVYWVIQHSHHHRTSDTVEDVHTPAKGLWRAWYGWLFDQRYVEFMLANKRAIAKALISSRTEKFERYYYQIIFSSIAVIALISWPVALMYFVAYAVEMFRIGAVNAACHRWGYRNHDTADQSRNNIAVGLLGMGFGWHNNHHADPKKLILTERWWEIDIEGYIAWALSKTASK
jgi:stearoyl-CoA desaturase (delta-9 desaturase)